MSDLGFSDAAVSLARSLADTVLSVSWSRVGLRVLGSPRPPLGLCNYGGLIDTLFTDVEGVA
jgi:hypothetical protein